MAAAAAAASEEEGEANAMPRYRADQNKIEKTRETPEQWSLPWARCGGESTTGASRLTRSIGERLNSRERERQSERCRRSAQCDFRRKISSFFGSQFATSVRHLQLQSSTLISKEEEISFKKLAPQGRVSRASQGKGRSAISLALIIGRLLPICTRINNSSLSWCYVPVLA